MTTAASLAPDFLLVDKHVALNPVARAVARAQLRKAMLGFQIRLRVLYEGERVPADCQAAAKCLAVASAVLEAQGQADTAAARVIAGGMGALADMARTGWLWRTRHATAVDQALQHAEAAYAAAPPRVVQMAHMRVAQIEQRVAAEQVAAGGAR